MYLTLHIYMKTTYNVLLSPNMIYFPTYYWWSKTDRIYMNLASVGERSPYIRIW
jgi:hypothetical protein